MLLKRTLIAIGIFTIIGIIFIFLYYKPVNYTHREQLSNYKTSENHIGYFEKKGTLNILNLNGSYDAMGQQYGALVYNQLHEINQKVVPEYFGHIKMQVLLSYILREYYNSKLDKREIELLKGMEKTSGLTYRQLLSIEMLPMLMTLYSDFEDDKSPDAAGTGHCSFLSIWGNLSKTKSMLIARNLDLPTSVTKLDSYYNLVIYNPEKNGNKVATFSFIGFIPGFTWINNKGLFSEYNDGRSSVPGFNLFGYVGLNTAFYGMLDSNSSEEFIHYVKDHPTFVSNFTAIVNKDNSLAIEHPINTKPIILNGQLPNTNFFTNLYRANFFRSKLTMVNCIEKIKDNPSYACVRYHHIEDFLKTTPKIGVDELKQLFMTPLDNRGLYQTGTSAQYPVAEVTNYTLIGNLSTGNFIYSNHQNQNLWINLNIYNYFGT